MLDKEIAITLRKRGQSYNEIIKKVKVSKGTLSYWFKNLKISAQIRKNNVDKAKKKWAENIIKYNKNRSRLARLNWLRIQNEARQDIKKLSDKELKLVGVALYWAEGYKRGNWSVIFSNSDLAMQQLMLRFFIKICKVSKQKITAQLQIHDQKLETKALDYWSKGLGLNHFQFIKTSFAISRSSKLKTKRILNYGTLRIRLNDVVLLNKIKGWIQGLSCAII